MPTIVVVVDSGEHSIHRVTDGKPVIPASVAEDVRADTDEESAGGTVGLSLRIASGKALVWRVEPGSPAAAAGIMTGQIVEQVVGLADKDSLKKLIDKHV
mgnify:CR=1 FL=1